VKRFTRMLLLCAGVGAVAIAVSATIGSAAPGKSSAAKAGGTYRVGWENDFGFTDAFDPTGEYLGDAWAVMSNLLVRTLVGYNHVAGAAGNKLVPDLATTLPKPTNGGKTYTFHLKSGVRFAPPVNRAVTSKDIAYAINRLANASNGGQYAFYYTPIKGWAAAAKGGKVSGISTPNNSTIVFNLTAPTGDFLFRMAMPATGPIPEEVGKCFTGADANKYGRNLVATGPYMYEGSGSVNTGSCSSINPASGFDGKTNMTLVRNPNYSARTDSKAARENLPDKFVFSVNTNADDIYNKVKSGELEDEVPGGGTPGPKVIREYLTNSSLKPNLKINAGDRTWYLYMNLTQPPFDDIHVRKALNLILDKSAMQKAWGGPTAGAIATHIVPDPILLNQIKGWDPYKTPGNTGSASLAGNELKKSKYDPKKSGKCTAPACKNILMVADTRAVDTAMIPVIESSAAKIGITFKVRTITGAYPTIQTPSKNVPISERPGWGKDYADASTFFVALFAGTSILPSGNTNYSLVGLTPAMSKKFGIKGKVTGLPSVDKDINRCQKISPRGLAAAGSDPRVACWAALDKKLMTQVVPWVPYLSANNNHVIGPKVAKWAYDQFGDATGYAHVAVK
jgi:peptide/nickel transport system substrate-binding protein